LQRSTCTSISKLIAELYRTFNLSSTHTLILHYCLTVKTTLYQLPNIHLVMLSKIFIIGCTMLTAVSASNIRSSGAVENSAEQAPHTVGPCSKCDNDDKGKFSRRTHSYICNVKLVFTRCSCLIQTSMFNVSSLRILHYLYFLILFFFVV
jgi:hypothetical protein